MSPRRTGLVASPSGAHEPAVGQGALDRGGEVGGLGPPGGLGGRARRGVGAEEGDVGAGVGPRWRAGPRRGEAGEGHLGRGRGEPRLADGVDPRDDARAAAEVRDEVDGGDLGARAELLEQRHVGGSEAVDRLLGVAHDEQPAGLDTAGPARQAEDELVLHGIGVLVLVDEQEAVAALQLRADRRGVAHEAGGEHEEVVEGDAAGGEARPCLLEDVGHEGAEEPLGGGLVHGGDHGLGVANEPLAQLGGGAAVGPLPDRGATGVPQRRQPLGRLAPAGEPGAGGGEAAAPLGDDRHQPVGGVGAAGGGVVHDRAQPGERRLVVGRRRGRGPRLEAVPLEVELADERGEAVRAEPGPEHDA
jgi:hypothetical protein